MEKDLDQYKYSVVADIERIYNEMGYNVHKKVLMCSDYNCATNRKRLFIVATRRDLNLKWEYPEPTTHDNKPTVKDAFDLLDYHPELIFTQLVLHAQLLPTVHLQVKLIIH